MSYAVWKAAEAARRGDLEALRFWAHVHETVDEAPPLSEEQRGRLAVLLRPSSDRSTAGVGRAVKAA